MTTVLYLIPAIAVGVSLFAVWRAYFAYRQQQVNDPVVSPVSRPREGENPGTLVPLPTTSTSLTVDEANRSQGDGTSDRLVELLAENAHLRRENSQLLQDIAGYQREAAVRHRENAELAAMLAEVNTDRARLLDEVAGLRAQNLSIRRQTLHYIQRGSALVRHGS